MKKMDLVRHINAGMELDANASHKEIESMLDALADTIQAELCLGQQVKLPGVGTLTPVGRKGRKGRNPQTGAEIEIPATTAVKFKPAKALKDAVAGK